MIIHSHKKTSVIKPVEKHIETAPVQELPPKEKASKKIRKRRDDIIITDPIPPIELP